MKTVTRITCTSILLVTLCLVFAFTAQAADTTRQYQLEKNGNGYRLVLKENVPVPELQAHQVLVRVHAASLNHRDVYILQGLYPGGDMSGHVPLSDGAGEVIAVGPQVSRFKIGDRVVGTFFLSWIDGKVSPAYFPTGRGATVDGMLSEKMIANEESLLPIPAHLSYEEASTLPCAGVTAWNGLFTRGRMTSGEYVLLEGTGGVSIFGLQFAVAAGAKPIITSSSDAKLARAKALGAVGTVNYRKVPDWQVTVRSLTNDVGVSQVLEVGGKNTLPRAVQALAFGGHIAMIGGLSGFIDNLEISSFLRSGASVSSIYVGSRADFAAMNAFISKHKIKPVVDKVFSFDDTPAAYQYMESGKHFGKIVIRL